jgi:hypothetical protein
VQEGTTVYLLGVPLSYQWVQVAGPAPATLATPNSTTTSVTGATVGTYVFRLIVSDSLATGFDEVTVTVEPGNQPELRSPFTGRR